MDRQVLLALADGELADVRGGDFGPGFLGGYGYGSPDSSGMFYDTNFNQNSATAVSTLLGPLFL